MQRYECHDNEAFALEARVSALMRAGIEKKNRIVPAYAKDWRQFSVSAVSMNMEDCYEYRVERREDGSAAVKGGCFIQGIRHEHSDWVDLTAEETAELKKIPLGLLLSTVVKQRNPYAMAPGMFMASDSASLSCAITYGDGKSDTKIPNSDMLRDLDRLIKSVFQRTI